MKWINYLCAIYWAVLFLMLIFGDYTPSKTTVGASFLFTALMFIGFGLEAD